MPFTPIFQITSRIASCLIRIEAARQAMIHLPINPAVLASLRESARLDSTHYSTMIEGNLLTQEEVSQVIARNEHFPGRERDEKEVLGYYGALEYVERLAAERRRLSETQIKTIHALVMLGGSKRKPVPTPYRDGQNVIRDSRSRAIVYMPPEASDVPDLMESLVEWVNRSMSEEIPCPIIAGLAHYQFATIHPYFDGNGRTARLLTTLILHLGGYDLKGLYSLEAYYARNLAAYYQALAVGPSHNYYMGRESADLTGWLDYFIQGMTESFESVRNQAKAAADKGQQDQAEAIRRLDPRQRKALELFRSSTTITSRDLESLFGISQRMARVLLADWVKDGFLVIANPAKKSRKYWLSSAFDQA
ncbi:MAG: Fic family protein [bacterium]